MSVHMSIQEYKLFLSQKSDRNKSNKYGAKRTTIDNITFDSKAEARRYWQLVQWQKTGEISNLQRQVPFELSVSASTIGKYIADFTYTHKEKGLIIEDVKGDDVTMTALFKWKVKHLKAQYGLDVTVIKTK